MTVVDQAPSAARRREHGIWARLGAEFAGSMLICFAIYLMCTFGSAFYNVNLAYLALGTGVVYAAMTAIFSRISGAQFNPAITVAAMLTSKTRVLDGALYIVAQLIGAICAGGLLSLLLPSSESVPVSQWYTLTVNGYDEGSALYSSLNQLGLTFNVSMAIIVELIASIIVVAAAMQSLKGDGAPTRQHTLTMGLAYAAATAMAYPITGAAVNPIRATGVAVFAAGKGLNVNPLQQLWVFWVSSILAAAIVALVIIVAQLLAGRSAARGADVDVAQATMLEEADDAPVEDRTAVIVDDGAEAALIEEDAVAPSAVEQEDAGVESKQA